MPKPILREQSPAASRHAELFGGLMGLAMAVVLFRYGNPVIFEGRQAFGPDAWPLWRALLLVILAGLLGAPLARWKPIPPLPILTLPLIWFAWQLISGVRSVDPVLTRVTLLHFSGCVLCFYLGVFLMSRIPQPRWFWVGLLIGFFLVLWVGQQQRWGGLEQTREFFNKLSRGELPPNLQREYDSPEVRALLNDPSFRQKMTSNRIFSTFVYPNALAGAILLCTPMLTMALWQLTGRLQRAWRVCLGGLILSLSVSCLWWSGSKSGWLIALLASVVILAHLPASRRLKTRIIFAVFGVGMIVFGMQHFQYFRKGASSLGARMDYWHAAVTTAKQHPWLGSGPGTFMVAYRHIKKPESEMTRLVHNDYLQQASDSGIPGFIAYSAFIVISVGWLYRKSKTKVVSVSFAAWIGLAAWAVHSLLEFNLYIPALSWIPFLLLGWLAGGGGFFCDDNAMDSPAKPHYG